MEIPKRWKITLICFLLLLDFISGDYDYFNDYTPSPLPPPIPHAPCNPSDSDTLLQIKQALNNSILFSSWLPNTDCCGWLSVRCDSSTGRVNSLAVFGNGFNTDIDDLPPILPPNIGNLTSLTFLFFYNNATGPIPDSLVNLQQLKNLNLNYNQLTGPIPSFFGLMQSLSSLDLSGNKLTGRIPASLSHAPRLSYIKLDSNMLMGRIPRSLGRLSNKNNNVLSLYLSNNRLSGTIPRSIGAADFSNLFLSGNRLTGDASFVFGKNKSVWQLDLSRNDFSFNLSNVEIPPLIQLLDLSRNRIYGGIPPALANLSGLYQLYDFSVSYNHLCGPIPQGGNLQRFDVTSYDHNDCLCGAPLPPCEASVP